MNNQLIKENEQRLVIEQKRLKQLLNYEGKPEGSGEFPGEYKPIWPEFGEDAGDNASEVTEYETKLGITRDLEARLTKVEAALKRIAGGTYGRCVFGDEIEDQRLLAEPTAETCLRHAK